MKKICVISDLHLEFCDYEGDRLQEIVDWVDESDPDLLACLGDISGPGIPSVWFDKFFQQVGSGLTDNRKICVPGNHDYWVFKPFNKFHSLARENGWLVPNPHKNYEVLETNIGNVLAFNYFITPQLEWGPSANDIHGTNDCKFFNPQEFMVPIEDVVLDPNPRECSLAVSHMKPRTGLPTAYSPSVMFTNPALDTVARHHGVETFLYGHTHEYVDTVMDNVRYVNTPLVNTKYENQPPSLLEIEL